MDVNSHPGARPESSAAVFHLEYLYGPQWAPVVALIERAAQLTADERERLNAAAAKKMEAGMSALTGAAGQSGLGGLANLLSGLGQGQQSGNPQPMQIAGDTAKQFGRSRNLQLAGLVAGQSIAPGSGAGDLAAAMQSLGSIGTLTAVSQAAAATVLSDLVGQGRFDESVYAELMQPWTSVIG
ncbi:hypothetical protein [Nocardia pseudobrasiliensis]|uniref:Uncharacterized protein n=1 Tax=Nocardia pseudobrasiliensis TaxID=45979 RepID=A0A370ICB4_9NOCA|nr:hypothetical protein [Nocardia pseudobrasiliensis]RDI68357.1 hypothetical protein DFR76_102758 [Nocardia pseudobrasiliensis]